MFESAKYIRNTFGVSFTRQQDIRRYAIQFEDNLKGNYFQPQIISVPDDLDPEVPRMIFGSQHGFSQIVVSQINITLNANYSPDWQKDISKGREHLLERVPILFDLLKILDQAKPCFSGLVTLVRLPATVDESAVLGCLARLSSDSVGVEGLYEIHLKTTRVHSDRFFSNVTMRNYRRWKTDGSQQILPRLSRENPSEQGIEIIGDFNDRFMYNEDSSYFSSQDNVKEIIDQGLSEIRKVIEKVEGVEV